MPESEPEATEPWYVTAFQDDYRAVYAHRDVPSARREVAWLAEHVLGPYLGQLRGRPFGPTSGDRDARILDLCCGFGRHSLALTERGFRVFGMDLSFDLLRASRDLASDGESSDRRPLRGRVARGDMRRLPYRADAFAAVVNLFTSFGYLGDAGDRAVLDEVARVLAPQGVLVMDLMNPAAVRAGLVPRSREERDGVVLEGRRALADDGRRITKEVRLTLADGAVRAWREDVRMYEADELDALLAARGLATFDRRGDFAGGAYGPAALRQIVLARRAL